MRIYEITASHLPGITQTVNDPNVNANVSPTIGGNGSDSTQSPAPVNPNSSQNASASQNIGTSPASHAVDNDSRFTQGSTINLPMGPSKAPTPMKIDFVTPPHGANREKDITVSNPLHPNAPGQTYKLHDIAHVVNDENNGNV